MRLFLAFLFGSMLLGVWELRGGPEWRMRWIVPACALVAVAFSSLRFVS